MLSLQHTMKSYKTVMFENNKNKIENKYLKNSHNYHIFYNLTNGFSLWY